MNIWAETRATVVTAVGLLLAYSVVQGWGWPLLAGPRAGIIVLGLTGLFACGTSGWTSQVKSSWDDPLLFVGIALGVLVLGYGVVGLFVNSMDYVVVMMVATLILWVISTIRHVLASGSRRRPAPTA